MKRKKKHEAMNFEQLSKFIHKYLQEEGWALNFRGFRDVLQRYFRLQDHDIVEIHELMIDCNLWHNYFAEIQSFIDLKMEEYSLEADWYFAHEVKAEPSEQLENQIQRAKERMKHFSMFSKHVESQKKFFWKASEHCYYLYKRSVTAMSRIS